MANFLLYWRPETVEGDDPDRVQWWAGSEWIGKDDVRAGDVIWAVTSLAPNDLRLVARIAVEQVIHSRPEAVAILGEAAWRDAEHFALGREEESRRKQDIDLSDIARRLTFEGTVQRLPKDFDSKNLQRMRKLTPESAAILQRAWNDGEASRPPRFVWQKDELILALDLYFRMNRTLPDETHPEVVALSDLLRQLPIHVDRHLDPTFRNPDGVALKLANFRSIDQPGKGMSRRNRLEQGVWDEFANDATHLRRTAALIAQGYQSEVAQEQIAPQDEEEEFAEGRIAYRLHKHRERNRELVRKKKQQARKASGRLACEVCLFDFEARYGALGADYIECHHTIPVSEMLEEAKTKLEDVVLVCSNCHRMIHRKRPWLGVAEIRTLLTSS